MILTGRRLARNRPAGVAKVQSYSPGIALAARRSARDAAGGIGRSPDRRARPRPGAILGRSMQSMAGITQQAPAARRR
jgi:hypothetical protein